MYFVLTMLQMCIYQHKAAWVLMKVQKGDLRVDLQLRGDVDLRKMLGDLEPLTNSASGDFVILVLARVCTHLA